jgi:hypothetical protein
VDHRHAIPGRAWNFEWRLGRSEFDCWMKLDGHGVGKARSIIEWLVGASQAGRPRRFHLFFVERMLRYATGLRDIDSFPTPRLRRI